MKVRRGAVSFMAFAESPPADEDVSWLRPTLSRCVLLIRAPRKSRFVPGGAVNAEIMRPIVRRSRPSDSNALRGGCCRVCLKLKQKKTRS